MKLEFKTDDNLTPYNILKAIDCVRKMLVEREYTDNKWVDAKLVDCNGCAIAKFRVTRAIDGRDETFKGIGGSSYERYKV